MWGVRWYFSNGCLYFFLFFLFPDLSKNKFWELPSEVLEFLFVEKLHLYHNGLRSLPDGLGSLKSLKFLDLSRNQLCTLPSGLSQLEYLEVLLVANNKLVALPNDIGNMKSLMELDASCNEITQLPRSLGQLKCLRALDLRKNLLIELPIELTYLKLTLLDMSENRITTLPIELRLMTSLEQLKINGNPLVSPPATLCMRGRVHIFKFLETQVLKTEKKRTGTLEDARRPQRKSEIGFPNSLGSEMRSKRRTVDSGYSTSDGMDLKWAQDFNSHRNGDDNASKIKSKSENIPITNGDLIDGVNGTSSCCSTPSTISPGELINNEDDSVSRNSILQDQIEAKRLMRIQANDRASSLSKGKENSRFNKVTNGEATTAPADSSPVNGNTNSDEKKSLEHIQTYREYKEALRLQRAQSDVYRSRLPGEGYHSTLSPTSYENLKLDDELKANQYNESQQNNKKPIQKVIPSRNTNYTNSYTNGDSSHIPSYIKPSSPVKTSAATVTSGVSRPSYSSYQNSGSGASRLRMNSGSPRPLKWNNDIPPDKLSFTMRREFEKAKEEAELIEQLRNHIETRLKMSLPEDIGPALMDGVVLCHLANHVRPRSVASIHVPSPAVPKLTMARCRRNVDNFLDACRKIGVEENLICCASDILEGRGLVQVSITVAELLRFHTPRSPAHSVP
ncbi:UNVERIFIED_CONTAM: hypothetical protein PYX00_006603 [Menopon gallinae]|uniref:Calponin-homology (CH) domain-containing protein n=1 Tax=Menopon gallinae TaxID=328185 RepID=A0AAW2HXB1_9NEOP